MRCVNPRRRLKRKIMNAELDQIADSAQDTATTVAEVAFGAAKTVAEVASDPIGSARKQVKGLERKGTPAARKVNRRFNARLNAATAPAKDAARSINARLNKVAKRAEKMMPERITVLGVEVNGKLPEKVVIKGFELVKLQARRRDTVGGVAKRTLRIFNGSFKTIAKAAARLEHATDISPKRATATRPATRSVARKSTKTRRARRTAARRRAA
jgi:gas vesicle protein